MLYALVVTGPQCFILGFLITLASIKNKGGDPVVDLKIVVVLITAVVLMFAGGLYFVWKQSERSVLNSMLLGHQFVVDCRQQLRDIWCDIRRKCQRKEEFFDNDIIDYMKIAESCSCLLSETERHLARN